MSRNKFNVNNRSDRVSLGNSFGARVQDSPTPKTLTTYSKSKSFIQICRGSALVPTPPRPLTPPCPPYTGGIAGGWGERGNHGGIAPTLILQII